MLVSKVCDLVLYNRISRHKRVNARFNVYCFDMFNVTIVKQIYGILDGFKPKWYFCYIFSAVQVIFGCIYCLSVTIVIHLIMFYEDHMLD